MERREFLRKGTLAAGSVVAGGVLPQAEATENACPCASNAAKLPQRAYGDTGQRLSIIGFGGIVVSGVEQEHANRVVAEAVEKGVNYFDVAPSYGDAEIKLGPALEPYRKNVFLACKTEHRTKEATAAELQESLKRLRTDYLDLYQLHAISDVRKDVDAVFAKGGAMEVFLEAKKAGAGSSSRLLRSLRGGGPGGAGPLRLRFDPVPDQLCHVLPRQLRPARHRGRQVEGCRPAGIESDGEAEVAQGRSHAKAVSQVLVPAADRPQ